MNRFLAFILKEFRHIYRDRRTMLILFGMPVVQVLLFGYVLTNEVKDANIAVLDAAKDEASTRLINKLVSSGYFRIGQTLQSEAELEPAFQTGKIKLALLFPPDFGHDLDHEGRAQIQLIGDASDPNTATTLINYANAIILGFQQERLAANGGARPALIHAETRMRYNPEQKAVFNFVPGVITLILMLVSAMMTSITLAREKELGTMEILLVSPLKPIQIVLGKAAPYLVLSFLNAALVVFIGIVVFGMPMRGSFLLLGLECFLYMFVALSLGILISTKAETQLTALFISALSLMMPTIILSGFMFPRESMPIPLQVIGTIFPATWFIPIIKGVMIKGVGLGYIWKETLILIGMAVIFIGVSIRNFKSRLE